MCAESLTTILEDEEKKVYYPELDCIRGLAILMLLLLHTDVAYYLDLGLLRSGFFQQIIFSGSVPVFFFLSGLGLTLKYRAQPMDVKRFYKTRYTYLIPPYLLWSFLIVAFLAVGEVAVFNPSDGDLISAIVNIPFVLNILVNYIFSVLTGNVYTLWFVFVLFIFYFLFPYCFLLFKKFSPTLRILVVLGVLILTLFLYAVDTLWLDLFFIGNPQLVVYQYAANGIEFSVDLLYLFYVIPNFIYFLVGITLGFHWERVRQSLKDKLWLKIVILAGAFLIFFLLEASQIKVIRAIRYNLFGLSSIFLFLMIFTQVGGWKDIRESKSEDSSLNESFRYAPVKFFWFNGQKSTGIYFTHRIIMAFVWVGLYVLLGVSLWAHFGPEVPRTIAFLYAGLSFLLTYLGCLVLIYILEKLPNKEYLIGK